MILPPGCRPRLQPDKGRSSSCSSERTSRWQGAYLWQSACQRCLWASPIRRNWLFLLVMAVGSVLGTFVGGLLLGLAPNYILLPLLAVLLLLSAVKVWRH